MTDVPPPTIVHKLQRVSRDDTLGRTSIKSYIEERRTFDLRLIKRRQSTHPQNLRIYEYIFNIFTKS